MAFISESGDDKVALFCMMSAQYSPILVRNKGSVVVQPPSRPNVSETDDSCSLVHVVLTLQSAAEWPIGGVCHVPPQ
jgi:hypothetical protein